MIVILTLGGVIFQDFEIPESIRGGGDQSIDIKKYLGGSRTIDALGRDDDPIEWTGRFRGFTAEQRCQQLNGLRIAGQQIELTWSSFRYQVIIKTFKFEYNSPMEITYRISMEVVIDETVPILGIAQTIDEIFGTNLATVTNLGAEANDLGITTDLNQLQTTLSTVQTLTGSNSATLNAINQDIVAAQSTTQTAINILSGQITPVAGSVFGGIAGLPPQTIAANVAGQASAFSQLSTLFPLGDTLSVMSKNLATVGP